MCPEDTSPEAWKVYLDIQQRMTPGEKLQLCLEWSELVRGFAEAGLRERYPSADDREIQLRYAQMTLGEEIFHKVYGSVLADEPNRRRP